MSTKIDHFAIARHGAPDWLHSLRSLLVLFAILSASLGSTAHAQVVPNEEFLRELQDGGLAFRETDLKDYSMAPIVDNPHMDYEFAVRSKKMPLEIRFAVRREDPSPKEAVSIDPEVLWRPMFEAVLLNIARGTPQKSEILGATEFRAEDVKKEFNAGWGATATVVPKKEFASSFDRCMVVLISTKRAGAFTFYLFNSRGLDAAMKELDVVFHTLRFR
jgi:hypothetical protein